MAEPAVIEKKPRAVDVVAGRNKRRRRDQPFCDSSRKDGGIAPPLFGVHAARPVRVRRCKGPGDRCRRDGTHDAA